MYINPAYDVELISHRISKSNNFPSGKLSRAGTTALVSNLAEPPSPSKPGSMEEAIRLWLKIGNIEKLQVQSLSETLKNYRYTVSRKY